MSFLPAYRTGVAHLSGAFLDGRSDVAAAFSSRRLRYGYTGHLVRVRRSSDSEEQDFGAGLPRLDWSVVSTFIGVGSGFAVTWYDQSGNGRNVTQATAASQPLISVLGNSLPGLTFDGSNDALVSAGFSVSQPTTVNLVYRQISQTQASIQNVFDGLTADRQTLFSATAGAENRVYAGTNGPSSDAGTSMPIGTRGAVGVVFNGASSRLEVNASTVASFTGDPSTNGLDGLTIGTRGGLTATRFDNIELQEFILFNTAHAQALVQADNAAMRAAWGF
jgi:hypothetical protein